MANKKNSDLDSPELGKLGKKVAWLQEKAAGAEELVTKIIDLKDASQELNIRSGLKSQQLEAIADYSPEAALRCARELKDFRDKLQKIEDELRFLPGNEDAVKDRRYALGIELQASQKQWQILQSKLEAAFARKEKAEAEEEEIAKKNKELACQQELAAKKEMLLKKVEMSRGIVAGKSAPTDPAVDLNGNN